MSATTSPFRYPPLIFNHFTRRRWKKNQEDNGVETATRNSHALQAEPNDLVTEVHCVKVLVGDNDDEDGVGEGDEMGGGE